MSLVAGHQPNLYPYGGFFAKAGAVDTFVIVDNTQYVKKQYHNRNRIKLMSGEVIWLGIPVRNAGRFMQKINEAEIDNTKPWARDHTRTLFLNYKKAAFFDECFPPFEELLRRQWRMLADFNVEVIHTCLRLLDITVPTPLASKEGIVGEARGLILDICRKTGSDSYLHGMHSRDYVDFPHLDAAGVRSLVQDFTAVEYPQVGGGPFAPNLSILDLLLNCGAAGARRIILGGNLIGGRP
jgi:hypothetical protein